jgi:hypothetical protein
MLARTPLRNRALAALAIAFSLALPASALADTEVEITSQGSANFEPYQSWADGMLAPEPPGVVDLRLASCPWLNGAGGCMQRRTIQSAQNQQQVVVYLATNGRNRRTFTHELGHVFERLARPSAVIEGRLLRLFDLNRWRYVARERFAEAYSLCARFSTIRRPVSTGYFGYRATPRSHARACRLIERAGKQWERRQAQSNTTSIDPSQSSTATSDPPIVDLSRFANAGSASL